MKISILEKTLSKHFCLMNNWNIMYAYVRRDATPSSVLYEIHKIIKNVKISKLNKSSKLLANFTIYLGNALNNHSEYLIPRSVKFVLYCNLC